MADKSPDAFRTISEAAEEIGLPQHVLRFWETRFSQIKPMKRGGGRRYYRPDDIELLKGIKHLLYDQGFTIKGAQKLIKQSGVKSVVAMSEGDMTALELVAGGEEKAAPPSSGPGKPARDTAEDDVVVGASKTRPSGKFFSRPDKNGQSGEGSKALALSAEHHALLQETLFELLECKRLLDQTR